MQVSSVNKSLAAVDYLCRFLGLGPTSIKRERLPAQVLKILTIEESDALLRILECYGSAKDKAVIMLFLRMGLRLGECAELNVQDVHFSSSDANLYVRNNRTNQVRALPLEEATKQVLSEWLMDRHHKFPKTLEQALFLNPLGTRMSTAGLDLIVRKMGRRCGLTLSAQLLRDTFLTNIAGKVNDPFVVAYVGGCKRLDNVSKYFNVSINNVGPEPEKMKQEPDIYGTCITSEEQSFL
jgi:site-specific recombinase XerD